MVRKIRVKRYIKNGKVIRPKMQTEFNLKDKSDNIGDWTGDDCDIHKIIYHEEDLKEFIKRVEKIIIKRESRRLQLIELNNISGGL